MEPANFWLILTATSVILTTTTTTASSSGGQHSILDISQCKSSGSSNIDKGLVKPIWIDPNESKVGFLQTPKFPLPFPLPLECLWIFDLTKIKKSKKYLQFYFTQFYLSKNLLMVTSLNSSERPLQNDDSGNGKDTVNGGDNTTSLLKWSEVDSLGTWNNAIQMHSEEGDTYILLKIKLNATRGYDRLHERVLEVNDVYGFNITYETRSYYDEVRKDVCNLKLCNYNGECFLNVNSSSLQVGDFFCNCAHPKFAPTQNEAFHGDRCQYHNANQECTRDKNPCKNGGKCRYQSSRYIDCQCPQGYEGRNCEMKKIEYRNDETNDDSSCSRKYLEIQAQSGDLEKAFEFIKTYIIPRLEKNLDHKVQIYKRLVDGHQNGQQQQQVGLISLRWEWNLAQEGIKSIQSLLKNSTRLLLEADHVDNDKDDKSWRRRVAKTLTKTNVTLASFCTEMVHPTPYNTQNLPSNILASHSKIVSLQEEFSLTCQIRNALSHPIIKWYKDFIYQINASVAQTPDRITMDLRRDESYQNDFLAILFIKDASEMDAGTFTCRVFDIGTKEATVPEAQLNQFPSTEAHINVEVVLRPKIDVYPASATLVKQGYTRTASEAEEATWSFHRHAHGHNQLHCFADPTVSWDVAGHYKFEWRKNGDTLMEKNQSQQQDLIEYIEELTKPPGLVLTLGKIDRDTLYQCRVYDDRDRVVNGTKPLVTEIEIPVYVAEKFSDTCSEAPADGIQWPRTKKGKVAVAPCLIGNGFEYYKCNPTHSGLAPSWHNTVNVSQCIRQPFLRWQRKLDLLLSGYVNDSSQDAVQLVRELFHEIPSLPKSQNLRIREWRIVLSLLRKTLKYAAVKPLPLNYTSMAESFYSRTLDSLSLWVRGLNPEMGPLKTMKIFDVFRLIEKSVNLFAHRLTMDNRRTLPQIESLPRPTKCQDRLIMVKFARLGLPLNKSLNYRTAAYIKNSLNNSITRCSTTNSSHNTLSYNTYKPKYKPVLIMDGRESRIFQHQPSKFNKDNKTSLSDIQCRHYRDLMEDCRGMTRVEISLKEPEDSFIKEAIVGIIHFKDLEDALNRTHHITINKTTGHQQNITTMFQRVSTLVAIVFDGPVESKLEIAITYYDFIIPNDGSSTTTLNNLKCASVNLPEKLDEKNIYETFWDGSVWNINDENCYINATPYLTCICKKSGMYALINQIDHLKDQSNSLGHSHEYIVILSCGCSLTLCLLTVFITLFHYFEARCRLILMHGQLSFTMGLIMIAIILKVANFLQKDYFHGISIFLHYLFTSSLCCQINMPAALCAELSWKYCQKEFKAFLITISLILPAFYTGIAIHYGTYNAQDKNDNNKYWFVEFNSSQFHVLLIMNLLLVISYLFLTIYLLKILRNQAPVKKCQHESITLIQRSVITTIMILIVEASLVYFVNASESVARQVILSIPCAAMGASIFFCFAIAGKKPSSSTAGGSGRRGRRGTATSNLHPRHHPDMDSDCAKFPNGVGGNSSTFPSHLYCDDDILQVSRSISMNSGHSIEFGRIDPQTSVTTANTTLNMEDTGTVEERHSLISGISRVNGGGGRSLSLGSRDSVKSRGARTPFLPAVQSPASSTLISMSSKSSKLNSYKNNRRIERSESCGIDEVSSTSTNIAMAQKIILPTCRLRLDSVEDQEYDLANTPEEEVDEIDFHSVNTNTEGLYNFNNVGESPLLNPQPLTSILNSLIHDDEDTLITKADVHHAISSRTTSSRSSPGCTIDMKICRTLSGSMKNDGGCESSSLLLSSSSGNNPESAGSEKIRIFDESEYVLMTNNNNAQISETIGIFDSNTID